MNFTLFTSDTVGDRKNCFYPRRAWITDEEQLRAAVAFDHVCAEYVENRRSISNYKVSDVISMDVDNEQADAQSDWITPEKIAELFPELNYAISLSRNHMKQKGDKGPRPRFHVYFPIHPENDPASYAAMKRELYRQYPFFDGNALDAGRFLFGCVTADVIWHEGTSTVDRLLRLAQTDDSIPEGRRNATLSRTAGKLVTRYGYTEEAYHMFLDQAERCEPPLEENELAAIWKSAGRFADKVQSQPGYIPPELYGASLKPEDFSDIGQAKVLALDCGSELVYTDGTDFLCYNGTRWVESKQKAVGLAESFLDRQLEDAQNAVSNAMQTLMDAGVSESLLRAGGKALERSIPAEQLGAYAALLSAQTYLAFVMKRRDIKYIMSALQAVKPMVELSTGDLDSDGFLLNCPDGTYDLREGLNGRRDHDPADYLTMVTAYAPGEEGKELWLESIRRIFQDDAELIDYVQQTVGLCAVGEVFQEAILISYGTGSNGKSTFWNAIAGAMGDYSGMISADALTVGCRRNVKPELAEIKGKRILIAAELEEGMRLSTSIVKQLCSTDEIAAEKKFKDPFKFRPSHTLVLYTNHLPRVGAMDTGIWRRLIVIPFGATIRGDSEIKNYTRYLLDHCGPAITAWIIEGAEKVIANNFKLNLPRCVSDAITKYRDDNDWMTHFLEECCETGEGYEEKSGELYATYRAYCARTAEFTRSTTEFYSSLEQRGFARHKRKKGIFILGLRIKQSGEDVFL